MYEGPNSVVKNIILISIMIVALVAAVISIKEMIGWIQQLAYDFYIFFLR